MHQPHLALLTAPIQKHTWSLMKELLLGWYVIVFLDSIDVMPYS
jgi:hypothetical protein